MPTTYAHDTFGKQVLRALPEEMQKLIRRHISLYRIGLHGPDILFYYGLYKNHVNQTGVRLHGEIAYPFFARGIRQVRKNNDDALLVYLLGFGCHFMLDSTCHPYIYHIENEVGHTIIEKEMDRELMSKEGLDPLTYFPAKGIIPSDANCETVLQMFPGITKEQIRRALCGMRRSTGLMVYQDGSRQRLILPLLKMMGLYGELGDHFMKKDGDPFYRPYLDILEDLFARAVDETPVVLEGIYRAARHGDKLPNRLYRNYKY